MNNPGLEFEWIYLRWHFKQTLFSNNKYDNVSFNC